jgi:transposase
VMTHTRYSEAFKRQVVEEISRGKYLSPQKAKQAYSIGGAVTVEKWIRKYGREDLLPKRIRIETMKEIDELKEARKQIRELKAAVSDAHIDFCLEKAYLEIACERLGEEREGFKKKNAMTLSDVRAGKVVK